MKILRSFKLKIALGVVTFTGLILLGFSAFFLSATHRIALKRMDRELAAMGIPQINRPHPLDHWSRMDDSLGFLRADPNKGVYAFMVYERNGNPAYTSRHWPTNVTAETLGISSQPGLPPERPAPRERPKNIRGPREDRPPPRNLPPPRFTTLTANDRSWRMMTMQNQDVFFVLALDLAEFQSELRSMQTLFILAIPVALLLLAVGGWLLAGQALRPVRTLTGVARQITARDLHQRVPVSKADPEFEELITILNGMLDRLEKSFQQATRFSADAAHELNTPLTILQGQMELAIQNASSEADQQLFAGLLEEVERLKTIVRKLLMLAKADTGQLKLHLERIDLGAEIDSLLHDADVLAPGLEIERELDPNIVILADPDLLMQVLQNLLSNAIKYNRPGGLIRLTLSRQADRALFMIGNTTPPAIALNSKLLFTRFYRGDSSRSRHIDGVGLGLNLSREIVLAHQGSLALQESKEGWVSFALMLPIPADQNV